MCRVEALLTVEDTTKGSEAGHEDGRERLPDRGRLGDGANGARVKGSWTGGHCERVQGVEVGWGGVVEES